MERRNALIALVCGGSAIAGGVVGVPAAIYALSTTKREGQLWRDIGPVEEFELGRIVPAKVQRDTQATKHQVVEAGIYVWRKTTEEIIVFSRSCTDLGCPVTFDAGSRCFFCPCHGGIFDQHGERMAGPPDRPLYRYANRIQLGILQVDLHSVPPMI